MGKIKAERKKTIDTPVSQGLHFLNRCIKVTRLQEDISSIQDKTIIGNMLDVCGMLPPKSVDLIITDPPYNLTKTFNRTTFTKKKTSDYEAYAREWLGALTHSPP